MKVSRGAALALASATLFGASTPFAKRLVGELSPIFLAGLLYLGSGAGLGLYRLARRGERGSLSRREMPWLAGAILFGGVLAPVLLMAGLRSTPAAAASLLLNLEGVFTALLAWFVFHENFDRRIALGMVLIVAGGLVLSWPPGGSFGIAAGALAVVAACLCWAIDNNFTQKVSGGDAVTIAATKGSVAGVINLGIALAMGPPNARRSPRSGRHSWWASSVTVSASFSSCWLCGTSGRPGRAPTSPSRPSWVPRSRWCSCGSRFHQHWSLPAY